MIIRYLSLVAAAALTFGAPAHAAEIKVLSPIALEYVLMPLTPEFERTLGHKLTIGYGTTDAKADRIAKEAADVGMTAAPLIDNLQRQGRIVADSRVDLAKVGIGAFKSKGFEAP
jgi:molybdate transport system substrate-binding protein